MNVTGVTNVTEVMSEAGAIDSLLLLNIIGGIILVAAVFFIIFKILN